MTTRFATSLALLVIFAASSCKEERAVPAPSPSAAPAAIPAVTPTAAAGEAKPGGKPYAEDFALICAEVDRTAGITNPAERAAEWATRVSAGLKTDEVRQMFSAMGPAIPKERYQNLQAGAAEVGVTGWTCPALEAYWAAP